MLLGQWLIEASLDIVWQDCKLSCACIKRIKNKQNTEVSHDLRRQPRIKQMKQMKWSQELETERLLVYWRWRKLCSWIIFLLYLLIRKQFFLVLTKENILFIDKGCFFSQKDLSASLLNVALILKFKEKNNHKFSNIDTAFLYEISRYQLSENAIETTLGFWVLKIFY